MDVFADHEPGSRRTAFDAADMQALALAEGVIEHTGVFAHAQSVNTPDFAGSGRDVLA